MRLEDLHWLAKAFVGDRFVDLIYGMGNGVAFIDDQLGQAQPSWRARGEPVRIAPAEELIWHRLFISERHRHDMSDIVHLILCVGDTLDWERLVARVGSALAAAARTAADVQLRVSGVSQQRAGLGDGAPDRAGAGGFRAR